MAYIALVNSAKNRLTRKLNKAILFSVLLGILFQSSAHMAAASGTYRVRVGGTVRDMETGKPISGAKLSISGQALTLTTDSFGVLPTRTFSVAKGTDGMEIAIEAQGYRREVSHPRVYPGASINITSQLVSVGNPSRVVVSYEAAPHLQGSPLVLDRTLGTQEAVSGQPALVTAQAVAPVGVPQTIRVYRTALNRTDVVPFNYYAKHVLPSEWIGGWPMESLKAGAMAVKTYAWYWINQGGKWPSLGADVKDSTADQVYDPGYSYPSTDDAVDATWNYKMTRNGAIFQSQYVAGSYAAGYEPGYEGRMSQWGSKYWADQGKGWQWMLHYYYGPTLGYWSSDIAISLLGRAHADFNGDGLSDAVSAYNYGDAMIGLWTFSSTGTTLKPYLWWTSGRGSFDANRVVSWVIGNFNGDAFADVAALYDYGGSTAGILVFLSNGKTFNAPTLAFRSTAWNARQTKLVAGNFDSDSKDEIAAFYGYGGTSTGVFLFDWNGSAFSAPRKVFHTNYWDWTRTQLVSGDFDGNGFYEVGAVYDYGGDATGIWTFPFTSGGSLQSPRRMFHSSQWSASRATYLSGDVNGDKKTDIIAPYNYGGTTTGVWVFKSNGSQFTAFWSYATPYWNYSSSAFVTGDYTGDGLSDLLGIYRWPSTTAAWLFKSNGSTIGPPSKIYETPYWNDANARWIR